MRQTSAIVDLNAIVHNYKVACQLASGSKSIAIIKANAYGHGMLAVARALEPQVPAFGVAFIDEAVQLRDAGLAKPILVLQGPTEQTDIELAVSNDFALMLHEPRQIAWLLSAELTGAVAIWLKVDTGMHRLGLPGATLDQVITEITQKVKLKSPLVLASHLASADELNNPFTRQQLAQIKQLAQRHQLPLSLANSAGIMFWPETHAQWNRPGYMLYGNDPRNVYANGVDLLRPAMQMVSHIMAIHELQAGQGVGYGQTWKAEKKASLATIPIGYADGYPRHAVNGTPVLVNGQRAALAGRVSMDMLSIDISDLQGIAVGDPVELWGHGLSVNEVAEYAGTIGYEILAGLSGRVPLVYEAKGKKFNKDK